MATPRSPEKTVTANPDWRTYRSGEGDRAGRQITRVYTADDRYVIYFIGCELYYDTMPELEKDLGPANAALARINRLLDDNLWNSASAVERKISVLELAGDAFEMCFLGERTEALEILNGLRDRLQARGEAQRRLLYEMGTGVVTTVALLSIYSQFPNLPMSWHPWRLAAALAMSGGLFSVCLSLGSLEVNVNQQKWFLSFAGATRSIVAFLAGVGLLLAMRSKMFAGITYQGLQAPGASDPLQMSEMFFCFLAGFSESFVPNILSKSVEAKAADTKAAADKSATERAAAEKAAAEKAEADKAAAAKAASGQPPLKRPADNS